MNAIIRSDLNYFIMHGIKPNFSELSRETGIDRHTLKKHFEAGGYKERKKRTYKSSLDKYDQIIKEKLTIRGITLIGIFKFLQDKYDYKGTYSNFKAYIKKRGYKKIKTNNIPHLRYETPYGKQLQVDWKERLKIETKYGEIIEFELFSATLSRSRLHKFIISFSKTNEAFMRCLIDTFTYIGGLVDEVLTDNMKAIVNIVGNRKVKHSNIIQLEKDLGIKIRLCKVVTPETKGKVESSNRFVSRLLAYNKEIEGIDDLYRIVNKLNSDINEEINQETKISPFVLFKKEKEYLKPLPKKEILESYIIEDKTCKVPSTLLVTYKGQQYSVPANYIDKRVKIIEENNLLYIYYNTELIKIHNKTNQKINYDKDDYKEGLRKTIRRDDIDIEEITKENLRLLGEINNE